jgi:hypothetical protein
MPAKSAKPKPNLKRWRIYHLGQSGELLGTVMAADAEEALERAIESSTSRSVICPEPSCVRAIRTKRHDALPSIDVGVDTKPTRTILRISRTLRRL